MQSWKKLGKIFDVELHNSWIKEYATCPFVYNLDGDVYRIFFSSRNTEGFSFGTWFDIDITTPNDILNTSKDAILLPGDLGCFDDAGTVPFQVLKHNNLYFLYYSGWTIKQTIPFDFHIGLAISNNLDYEFKRYSRLPILDRTENEPFLIGAPFVIKEESVWKMWYVSGDKWQESEGTYKHYYAIKYAESGDGINWPKRGVKCITYDNEFEYAFARPFVLKENELYKMWYSYRAQKNIDSYRIGYAESEDGINWNRKDEEVGIDVSESGWDSEMICYPFVFDHKGKRYMLYNGNDYGKTGFGLAVLESEW